jgi:HD-GYP domain-containing protein (c-di-GMP phosphodiesterase class II)
MIAVTDTLEAMSSQWPNRAALEGEAAVAEIASGRGKLFDPAVVDERVDLVHSGRIRLGATWE